MAAKNQKGAASGCPKCFSPKNIWSALRAAKEKAALSGDNFPFSSVMVSFYAFARTYFEEKC
jgi:hypothetical protein